MTFFAGSVDKELVRGDDRDLPLVFAGPRPNPQTAGTPINLTGALITFTAKLIRANGAGVHADAPSIRKTSDDTAEIEVMDAVNGVAVVHLVGADTRFLPPGVYAYDVQLRLSTGQTYTTRRGKIYLVGDVSSAEDITP